MSEALNSPEAKLRRFRPYPKYKDSGVEWLGEIPANWKCQRLRHACKRITDGSHYSPPAVIDGRPYVTVRDLVDGSVDADNAARISEGDFRSLERNGCRPHIGDVLFSKDGTVGKVALVERDDFVVLSSLAILQPGPYLQSSFLFQFLSSAPGISQIESKFAGAALRRITLDVIVDLVTSIPPMEEQRTIAAFLDHETAKIDVLIERKERLIKLLQEKRKALVTQAVTKGLDPNVPMRDSGVEWLGEVPTHWDVLRLKYLSSINDEVLNEKTDPRFELIYVDIGGVDQYQGIVASEELVFETAPSRARRIVRDGDVIISTVRTYLRAIAPIKHPESNLIVSTGFAVIRPSSALECNFAPYALRASYFVERIVANSVGVSYPAIDTSKMSCFPTATPDIEEQQEIASFLESEMTKIDALVAKIREAIDRLKEYRTALISAAVTGKIDVREIIA